MFPWNVFLFKVQIDNKSALAQVVATMIAITMQ